MNKVFKQILIVITTAVIAIAAVLISGAVSDIRVSKSLAKDCYKESLDKIENPDQGFYRPIYVRLNENGATFNKNIINDGTQLYHLRIDLCSFSTAAGGTDKPLTDGALEGLNSVFQTLQDREKSAIVRFAYDPAYGGKANMEPDFNVLLGHIRQASAILNKFTTAITAMEAGFIGPWGEMHTSKISDSAHTSALIDEILKNTVSFPVLVRTPKKIYDYLGITVNDAENYIIGENTAAYRLGLHNDGYLGSENDLGTYTDRAKDTAFLERTNSHLPYGGEAVIPSSPLHNIENCLPEMNKLSLSYLNVEWNNAVIEKWKTTCYTSACGNEKNYYNQTAFTYIQNRLGYRLVLKNSKITYSVSRRSLNIKLKTENVGFGNMYKQKQTIFYLTDESGNVAYSFPAQKYCGENAFEFSQKIKLANGRYRIYFCAYGEKIDGKPAYALRFANNNIWDGGLKANFLGEIKI